MNEVSERSMDEEGRLRVKINLSGFEIDLVADSVSCSNGTALEVNLEDGSIIKIKIEDHNIVVVSHRGEWGIVKNRILMSHLAIEELSRQFVRIVNLSEEEEEEIKEPGDDY